jgi:hypothetical protein
VAKKKTKVDVAEEPTDLTAGLPTEPGKSDDKTPGALPKPKGEDLAKSDVNYYPGGIDINLKRIMKSGETLETVLTSHIQEVLDQELLNQEKLVKNIARAERQYSGRKKTKTFPWYGSSNISTQDTRKNVQTLAVRVLDAIFNRKKIFIVKANKPELVEKARDIENAMDWFFKHIIRLKEKIMSPLIQSIKCGTGIVHICWEQKRDTIYRYATEEEREDSSVHKYAVGGSKEKVVKDIQTYYEGPQWIPVPREDFMISSEADNIKDAKMCGFRTYSTLAECRATERSGRYIKGSCDKLFDDKYDEVKESRAENQGKDLTPPITNRPVEKWTLWFKFDVDEDGEPDSIVVTYHSLSNVIMKAIYNPVFTGNRPFFRLVGDVVQYSFDGDGLCNVLYPLQEAVDTIVNQRIDRGTLLNCVSSMSRSGIGLDNYKFAPGKHWIIDDNPTEDVFRLVQMPDVPPSQFSEEMGIKQQMERLSFNSPALMGVSTSERPVAKETFALIEEANKGFKNRIDNYRDGLTEGAYQTLELMAQYQPNWGYKEEGPDGQWVDRSLELPVMSLREAFDIELAASTEVLSQEVRREVGLNVFMLVRQFQTDLGGMAQMLTSPNVPSDMKKVIMEANRIGVQILKQILLDFDLPNAEELVLDLQKTVDVDKLMAASPDLQAEMGPPGAQGPATPGGPGPGMVPPSPSGPGPTPEMPEFM